MSSPEQASAFAVRDPGADAGPLFLSHATQLVTLRNSGDSAGPRRGVQMRELGIIEDGALLIANGVILGVGSTDQVAHHELFKSSAARIREVNCHGNVVLPGFVDSHTHPVFTSPRLIDFEKRIAGASYEEIAEAGGGIRSSIRGVRQASGEALAQQVFNRFDEMARQGTTTIEAKSGYGLSLESELKSLEAIREAAQSWKGTTVATLLGAHVVPPEFRDHPDEYVRLVCEEMIPAAAARKLVKYIDVFCERGAFTVEQSRRIFRAATTHGLGVRAHVCQLTAADLAPLIEFHPASLDHMDWVRDEDVARLAPLDTVATLLPGANYFLGLRSFPPARKLMDAGVAVAVATDYNPGTAPTSSMQFVLSAACTQMKMTPAEAITAATYNGACALGLGRRKGSLEAGKDADIAVFDAGDYRELAYWFGSNRCRMALLAGEV